MSETVNVLCLHGCCQTKDILEKIMKEYIRLGEKQYNLKYYFAEAKYNHPDGGKTWYSKPLIIENIGKVEYDKDLTDPTLDYIEELINELDIKVLFGFSQGGNVVDTFINYRDNPNIKAVVILSGYSFYNSTSTNMVNHNIPVLGVASMSDTIVPFALTPGDNILVHNKGHKVPTRKSFIRRILKFMQTQLLDE